MARNLSPWRTKELDLQVIWHDLWLWKIGDMYRIDSNWQTQVGNGSKTPSRPNSCTIHELWMMQTKWKSSQACLCLPISLSSQVALVLNGQTPVDWSPIGLPDASTCTHRLRTSKSSLSILSTCFSSFPSFHSQWFFDTDIEWRSTCTTRWAFNLLQLCFSRFLSLKPCLLSAPAASHLVLLLAINLLSMFPGWFPGRLACHHLHFRCVP